MKGSNNMAYTLCKRLIEAGRTDNMLNKLDIFFAVGRITDDEYIELTGMLIPVDELVKGEETAS